RFRLFWLFDGDRFHRGGEILRGPSEFRLVSAGRQGNLEFAGMFGLEIILGDTAAKLSGGCPHDRIGIGVVRGIPSEDVESNCPFLGWLACIIEPMLDDIAKQTRVTPAL